MERTNMLDFVLDARLENLSTMAEYNLGELKQRMDEHEEFDEAMEFIDNLPLPIDTKTRLSNMIFELEGINSDEFSKFTNMYYKMGFSDAVNIIFDAKEYKKTGEN